MKNLKSKINLLFLAILALTLQSCFFVAGAAAGAAAIAIVYDHRNVDSILQDQKIAREVLHRIQEDPDLHDNAHINVTCFGQVVLLTGETPDAALKKQAEDITRGVHGVNRVYNAITIQGATSALSHASDAWITTKIKSEMLATKGLQSASIKVVTENGTVYLMGTVTHEQEATILNIVRQANGVQKVIKIFQYKENEAELKQDTQAPVTASQDGAVTTASTSSVVVTAQGKDDMQPLIAG